jgi:hypothetical protein
MPVESSALLKVTTPDAENVDPLNAAVPPTVKFPAALELPPTKIFLAKPKPPETSNAPVAVLVLSVARVTDPPAAIVASPFIVIVPFNVVAPPTTSVVPTLTPFVEAIPPDVTSEPEGSALASVVSVNVRIPETATPPPKAIPPLRVAPFPAVMAPPTLTFFATLRPPEARMAPTPMLVLSVAFVNVTTPAIPAFPVMVLSPVTLRLATTLHDAPIVMLLATDMPPDVTNAPLPATLPSTVLVAKIVAAAVRFPETNVAPVRVDAPVTLSSPPMYVLPLIPVPPDTMRAPDPSPVD